MYNRTKSETASQCLHLDTVTHQMIQARYGVEHVVEDRKGDHPRDGAPEHVLPVYHPRGRLVIVVGEGDVRHGDVENLAERVPPFLDVVEEELLRRDDLPLVVLVYLQGLLLDVVLAVPPDEKLLEPPPPLAVGLRFPEPHDHEGEVVGAHEGVHILHAPPPGVLVPRRHDDDGVWEHLHDLRRQQRSGAVHGRHVAFEKIRYYPVYLLLVRERISFRDGLHQS